MINRPSPALFLGPVLLALGLLASGCVGSPGPVGNTAVPQPAKPVELNAYLGRWHEYARYEAPFQKGCEGVTADYALRDTSGASKIRVVNSCYQDGLDGEFKQSTGRAKVVEGSDGAKLKVSFFGPFFGDYWVLDRSEKGLDGMYKWAIVGEPSGRYLWILTRRVWPGEELESQLKAHVRDLGYDWSLVRITDHGENPMP